MDAKTTANRAHHGPRIEDDYLVRGAGRFVADDARAWPGLCGLRALAACLRAHRLDRLRGGQECSRGVMAVLTGRGHGGGRRRQCRPPRAAVRARRQEAHHAEPPGAGARSRDACRRAGRDGDRGDRAGGAGRRRAVVVEYEEIKPVIDVRDAVKPDAPQLWPEAPGNIAVDWPGLATIPTPTRAQVDEIIRSAAHVARVAVVQPAPGGRLDGAARRSPRATTRRPTATRCAPARRAPARCATTSSAS